MEEFKLYTAPEQTVVESSEQFLVLANELCDSQRFEKALYQHFMEQYLSVRTVNRSILLYHSLGTGKTCNSIGIAEALLNSETGIKVWVVAPRALLKNYEIEINSKCTDNSYTKMVVGYQKMDKESLQNRVKQVIRTRYIFLSYEEFATKVDGLNESGTKLRDTLIVVDEAHNLRIGEVSQLEQVKLESSLKKVLLSGDNNRLVLLSATPMYDRPNEISWLLSLCRFNDKIKDGLPDLYKNGINDKLIKNEDAFRQIALAAQKYVSYVKNANPFVFPKRFTPAQSGYPILNSETAPKIDYNGKPIQESNKWYESIRDGIYVTELGEIQKRVLKKGLGKEEVDEEEVGEKGTTHLPRYQQATNIVYNNGVNSIGDKGLLTVLQTVTAPGPIQYSYIDKKTRFFDLDSLKNYSAKISAIINIIKKSTGIVMVYSNYIAGGVLPIACALEHIGYKRYNSPPLIKGGSNTGSKFSYAIISGRANLMNDSNEKIVEALNDPANKDGERIKVLLISPVASEGFSFKNIREVHILDPWYHLNKIEQITGRAIRTCSHISLPLEQRNVTIFLHASSNRDGRLPVDMHAYIISARKIAAIEEVNQVLESNALDCQLEKYSNWIPSSAFKFDVTMRTSQDKLQVVHFGSDSKPIECVNTVTKTVKLSYNDYKLILPTLYQRLNRYLNSSTKTSFELDELLNVMGVNKQPILREAALSVLVRFNNEIENYRTIFVRRVKREPIFQSQLRIKLFEKQDEKDNTFEEFISLVNKYDDPFTIIFQLLTNINSEQWTKIAKLLIEQGGSKKTVEILTKYGLILDSSKLGFKGFVDVYRSNYSVTIFDNGNYRDAGSNEIETIKRIYKEDVIVDKTGFYGFLDPYTHRKDLKQTIELQFKLMIPEQSGAKNSRRGQNCENYKIDDIRRFIGTPGLASSKANKKVLCFDLAKSLYSRKLLILPPVYKPKIQ